MRPIRTCEMKSQPALSVFCGGAFTFLAGGAVYGYQAILPLLTAEGAMSTGCSAVDGMVTPCERQRLRLNLVFTVTMACLFVFVFVFGWLMDRLGARTAMGVAVASNATGTLLLLAAPYASKGTPSADACWALGFILWGVASPGVFTSAFALATLYPDHSGVVTSIVICAFDAAAFVFLAMKLAYDHADASWTVIMLTYLSLCAVMGVITVMSLPEKSSASDEDVQYERLSSDVDHCDVSVAAATAHRTSLSVHSTHSLLEEYGGMDGGGARSTRASTGGLDGRDTSRRRPLLSNHSLSTSDVPSTSDALQRYIAESGGSGGRGSLNFPAERSWDGKLNTVAPDAPVDDTAVPATALPPWHHYCRSTPYLLAVVIMICFTLKNSFYIGTLSDQVTV